MNRNMGTVDKAMRILFAATVGILYVMGVINGIPAAIVGGLAGIMVLTSLVGFCPLYLPIGLSTVKKEKTPSAETASD